MKPVLAIPIRILLFATISFLILGSLVSGSVDVRASSGTANRPVFVWLFGYTGQYFLPQTQGLGITPTATISAVKTLSTKVGKSNLVLVSAVGEEPDQPPWGVTNVNWGNSSQVSMLKSYVTSLKSYASGVYARLDFQEFNTSSSPTISTEMGNFVNKVGVNGFWLDHGPNLYNIMGQTAFSAMMQKLANSYPKVTFIVNDAVGCPAGMKCTNGGWITPVSSDNWQAQSYISPSVASDTYNQLNGNTMNSLGAIWGSRMILHYDAYAQVNTEPMGIFASQSAANEKSAITSLTNEGISGRQGYSGHSYYFMYPMLGASTYNGNLNGHNYKGTLYNSLGTGTFARNTIGSFTTTMAGT